MSSSTRPGGSRYNARQRPPLISELADEAIGTIVPWNDSNDTKNFKRYLKYAQDYRQDGMECIKNGDLETGFIRLAQAATLILEKLPVHSQYTVALNITQRHNLGLNGQDILDKMGEIKPIIVDRYDKWMLEHPDGVDKPLKTPLKAVTFSTPDDTVDKEFKAMTMMDPPLDSAAHIYPSLEPTMSKPPPYVQVAGAGWEDNDHRPQPVKDTRHVADSLPQLYPALGPTVVVNKKVPNDQIASAPTSEGNNPRPTNYSQPLSSSSSRSTRVTAEDLTGSVVRDSEYPAHGGGYADVYKGVLRKNDKTTKVAIKIIRAHIYMATNQWKIDKRLRREIRVWSGLRHPNIVPLLGTTTDFGAYTAMVCPWMNEGNLNQYLNETKPELNLRRRLQILVDIVEGLNYLHLQSVVHGDLTTANVLMDGGKAHLTDFGLSNVMAEVRNTSFLTSTVGGAPRWTAPELIPFGTEALANSTPDLTKHCDIYSFGSVALQVISGKIPYANIVSDFAVLMEIMKGSNPARPPEPLLSDAFWEFIVLCLSRDPLVRPEIDQVRETLQVLRYSCSEEDLAANIIDSDKPPEMEDEDGE